MPVKIVSNFPPCFVKLVRIDEKPKDVQVEPSDIKENQIDAQVAYDDCSGSESNFILNIPVEVKLEIANSDISQALRDKEINSAQSLCSEVSNENDTIIPEFETVKIENPVINFDQEVDPHELLENCEEKNVFDGFEENSESHGGENSSVAVEFQSLWTNDFNVNGDKIPCPVAGCKSPFVSRTNIARHLKSVHTSPIKCPQVGCDQYVKSHSLHKHMKTMHHSAKWIICSICGRRILRQKFERHLERCAQAGTPNFICTFEDCGASFMRRSGLRDHLNKVHVPPIKCPFENCTALVKESSLSRHLKVIHQQVTRLCKTCGKHFTFNKYKYHVKGCNNPYGITGFRCTFDDCGKLFMRPEQLAQHFRRIHRSSAGESRDVPPKEDSLKNDARTCETCRASVAAESFERHSINCALMAHIERHISAPKQNDDCVILD